MNDHEQLTDLIDDDSEMATRVLPRTAGYSYPPVALAPPPPRKSAAPIWAAVIGVVAVFGLATVAGGAWVFRDRLRALAFPDSDTATTTTATTPAETPTATTAAAPTAPEALDPLVVATPSHDATTHAAATTPHGSGTLQTFAIGRGKTIAVDGRAVGVGGSRVKIACGRHSISVGSGKARSYEIPCNGGVVTVGTPDGT